MGRVSVHPKIGRVAIDFDGVLHPYKDWDGPVPKGGAIPEGYEMMLQLMERNHPVDILTVRPSFHVWKWLEKMGLHDKVGMVTDRKHMLHGVFIDDRAIRFEGSAEAALIQVDMFEERVFPWWRNV